MEQEAISIAVKQFLDDAHFKYRTKTTPDGHAVICTRMRMPNSSKSVSLTIEIRETHMAIHAHCAIKASPEYIGETTKFWRWPTTA
jgi:hypothetical protein